MKQLFVVPVVLGLVAMGCSGAPDGEVTAMTESPLRYVAFGGFSPFGGASNLCMAVAGSTVAVGAELKSETCDVLSIQQGWVLNRQAAKGDYISALSTISPQYSPSLCIDLASGLPALARCQAGSETQEFEFSFGGGQIRSNAPAFDTKCLNVMSESTTSGEPIDLVTCSASPAQLFWMWGFSTWLQPANGVLEAVINTSFGAPVTVSEIWQYPQPNANFYLQLSGQIVQVNPSYGVAADGQPYGAPECLTVTGLSGTSGQASLQPCANPAVATQLWHEQLIDGNMALVTAAKGRSLNRYATTECLQTDGSVQACSGQLSQAWVVWGGDY